MEGDSKEAKVKWKNCLLGYFLGPRPYYIALKNHLSRIWRLKGDFDLIALPNSFFLFKFNLEEDCTKVLETSTTCGGRALILQKWYPGCALEKMKLSSIPVWIKFPALHLKYWTPTGFEKLASLIGKPVYMDTQTAEASRLYYARVCVEVFASNPLSYIIHVYTPTGDETQAVEHEWKPNPCTLCNDFSHTTDKCSQSPSSCPQDALLVKQKWVVKRSNNVADGVVVAGPNQQTAHLRDGVNNQKTNQPVIIRDIAKEIDCEISTPTPQIKVHSNKFSIVQNLDRPSSSLEDIPLSGRKECSGMTEDQGSWQLVQKRKTKNLLLSLASTSCRLPFMPKNS
ncbi:uncharacterized protein LOC143861286 [Tasmannia lanceolata]|uniref:uncharacterized protein LOC143861286 n=1 Tax=Tasmannia lanceolata TaxID=3420 RepID=UPI00406348AA